MEDCDGECVFAFWRHVKDKQRQQRLTSPADQGSNYQALSQFKGENFKQKKKQPCWKTSSWISFKQGTSLPLLSHVHWTHPSDHWARVQSNHGHRTVRCRTGGHAGVQLSQQRPPKAQHFLWGDGADHPLHVQHHSLPENRWEKEDTAWCQVAAWRCLTDADVSLSLRIRGGSRRAVAGSPHAGCGLHHHIAHHTLHLRHFHQRSHPRGRSLLYPPRAASCLKCCVFFTCPVWSRDLNRTWPDMISRSLGPEFGGSIGLMFFLAKVCACGEYVLGLVEAILDVFGADPGK